MTNNHGQHKTKRQADRTSLDNILDFRVAFSKSEAIGRGINNFLVLKVGPPPIYAGDVKPHNQVEFFRMTISFLVPNGDQLCILNSRSLRF